MSDVMGAGGEIYGSPEDWGLSRQKHSEMCAELEDHLYCLQSEEGIPAADAAREELNKPKTRRKLAGVHLTDQVYATLNRLPTKQEWRELIFLLICFGVILLGDWLAYRMQGLDWDVFYKYGSVPETSPSQAAMLVLAWLFQGIGRAAFFSGLIWSLWRAWRLGAGVLLARILQLKLIHTILVVSVGPVFGGANAAYYAELWSYTLPWPVWLTGPVIFASLFIAAILIALISRGRQLAWSLGLLLCGVFLAPGGPVILNEYLVTRPLVCTTTELPDGKSVVVPLDDPDKIAARATRLEELGQRYPGIYESIDPANNQYTYLESMITPTPGIYTKRDNICLVNDLRGWNEYVTAEPTGNTRLLGPLAINGAGFGWLALPIPILGLIGFIGLVVIMGRRGLVEFIAYSTICLLAVVSTVFPFIYESTPQDILQLGPLGIVTAPLPAFDYLMAYFLWFDTTQYLIVGGLVLSAGVPWLLTSLFLRPSGVSEKGVDVSNDPLAE